MGIGSGVYDNGILTAETALNPVYYLSLVVGLEYFQVEPQFFGFFSYFGVYLVIGKASVYTLLSDACKIYIWSVYKTYPCHSISSLSRASFMTAAALWALIPVISTVRSLLPSYMGRLSSISVFIFSSLSPPSSRGLDLSFFTFL